MKLLFELSDFFRKHNTATTEVKVEAVVANELKKKLEDNVEHNKQHKEAFSLITIPRELQYLIFEHLEWSDLNTLRRLSLEFSNHKVLKDYLAEIYKTYQYISKDSFPLYPLILKTTAESKQKLLSIIEKTPELACDIQYINGETHNFFTWAVKLGKQDLLDEIYQRQCQLIGNEDKATHNGFTKLQMAVLCNQSLETIKQLTLNALVSLCYDHRNSKDIKKASFSALMCAVIMNRLDVLTYFFEKNKRLDVNFFMPMCEFSTMMLAVIFNRTEMVPLLLSKEGNIEMLSQKSLRKNRDFLTPYLVKLDEQEQPRYSAKALIRLMQRQNINEKVQAYFAEEEQHQEPEEKQSEITLKF